MLYYEQNYIFPLVFSYFLSITINLHAQSHWSQQEDFPGTPRSGAVSAIANGKAYYGTGTDGNQHLNDWWEYDPASGVWKQLADFPGIARKYALAFSLNDSIYVISGISGTFSDATYHNDFYLYIPQDDTWQQLPDFPGIARSLAVSAVVDSKAYIGTGRNASDQLKDWWEYDPNHQRWTQKADLTSDKRQSAFAFTLDSTIFVGSGQNTDGGTFVTNNFYAYSPENDSWDEVSFAEPHLSSLDASTFVIGDTAYVFGGSSGLILWKYHATSNQWTAGESLQIAGESNRTNASVFVFSDHALIVGGSHFSTSSFSDEQKAEVWSYHPTPLTLPAKPTLNYEKLFEVDYNFITIHWHDNADNEKGYIVEIQDPSQTSIRLKDTIPANSTSYTFSDLEADIEYNVKLRAYNQKGTSDYLFFYTGTTKYLEEPKNLIARALAHGKTSLQWTDKSVREDGFLIEMSINDTLHFQKHDTVSSNITTYTIENLSENQTYFFRVAAFIQDSLQSLYTWQNPGVTPFQWGGWQQEAQIEPEQGVSWNLIQFSVGENLYAINAGDASTEERYLLAYNTATKEWIQKAPCPYIFYRTNIMVIGEQVYFVSGEVSGGLSRSVYVYDTSNGLWSQKNDFPGSGRVFATGFGFNGKGYIIGGDTVAFTSGNIQTGDVWEYHPANDDWVKKRDFIGGNRQGLVAFPMNGAVFIGLGSAYSSEIIQGGNIMNISKTFIRTTLPPILGKKNRLFPVVRNGNPSVAWDKPVHFMVVES